MKKITSSLLLIGLLSSGLCFAGFGEGINDFVYIPSPQKKRYATQANDIQSATNSADWVCNAHQ
jgi:hypothetical protein